MENIPISKYSFILGNSLPFLSINTTLASYLPSGSRKLESQQLLSLSLLSFSCLTCQSLLVTDENGERS